MMLVWLPLLSLGLAGHPSARRVPAPRSPAARARVVADGSAHAEAVGALPVVYRGPTGTPLLDAIYSPADVKRLAPAQLKQLATELRHETLTAVSQTGGHLGSSLGVVELTVALHYVFNAPEDPIVWDVSHQVYPHKILTGRRSRMSTLRQKGGLSGFAKRAESIFDPFGAGHSSTSISAALGARARAPAHAALEPAPRGSADRRPPAASARRAPPRCASRAALRRARDAQAWRLRIS